MAETNIKKLVEEAHIVNAYELTEEDVVQAASYVPTAMKMAFVTYARERCLDTLDISATNGNGGQSSLPSRYKVNTDKRSRYLMSALVGMYFGKDLEREDGNDVWLMSVREYDMYAGGHIFEMLNRMKNNSKVRDKCFNLMADYSELKYRLDAEIQGILGALNDSATRLLSYVQMMSTPEAMREALEAATQNQELLDNYMAEHEHVEEGNANGIVVAKGATKRE